MRLTDFTTLTFDCYGTLIDWESGLLAALRPLLAQTASPPPPETLLTHFARLESAQQAATPTMPYPRILKAVHRQLAADLALSATEADHHRFGASVPDWPAFPDSPDALRHLQQHYRLVILSNVDNASFAASQRRLGVDFTAVYTAEDIGSYKPDPANFAYLIARLAERGTAPNQILHTAQSLFHDHAPARSRGLATAWIDRRHANPGLGATAPAPEGTGYDFRFTSMAALAEAHRRALA